MKLKLTDICVDKDKANCCSEGDSTKFHLVKNSDHKLQWQIYLSQLDTIIATKMEMLDLDDDTIVFFPQLGIADPDLGDANIMVCQAELDENNQITGGLVRFVTGLRGFVICLILDKGFYSSSS